MRLLTKMKSVMVFTVVIFFVSCSGGKKQQQMPAIKVPVVNVIQQDVPLVVSFAGQIYSDADVGVASRVEGQVVGIHFKEGSRVKKGDLLYTIDPIVYQNKVDQAEGNLAEAQTYLIKAKSDLARIEPLAKINAVSQKDLQSAQAQVEAYESRVKAMLAVKNNAKTELGYTRITAPIDGVIGISQVQVGAYVGMMSSKVLNTISQTDVVKFRFAVSEKDYLKFISLAEDAKEKERKLATDMTLTLSDGSTYPHKGKFHFADRQIDPTTGALLMEAIFPNPDRFLKSGMYGKINFEIGIQSGAMLVPLASVTEMQGNYLIQVVGDSNKVVQKPVKPASVYSNAYIIESGLELADKVIMGGSMIIRNGMFITPEPVEWSVGATSPSLEKGK
ncbi:MAG: efflux RND transporter periplasmic adaptor subunit [Sphingobacteriia bacterium]|nr:efflux RND transporter periplasmic adaptor subunit [Sphingobacteriia bacterium]